jgi:hypothetical protein
MEMKPPRRFFLAAILLPIFLSIPPAGSAESGPPQRQLKVFPLQGNPSSADISPDETLVATLVTRSDSTKTVEAAQLWDFRHERLIAEMPLVEVATASHGVPTRRFTRFTSDGTLVVVYLDHCLYVLSGIDLHRIREIPLTSPPDKTESFESKSVVRSYTEKASVEIFEVSPTGHRAAATWVGAGPAQLEVYDLDSGKRLSEFYVRPPAGLRWDANGQQFILAVDTGNQIPSPNQDPDLLVIDALSGAERLLLNTGMAVGGIAITPDGRAWVVDRAERGLFTNHTPKMKVFDLHTGKQLRKLEGHGSGVRYAVSASRSGDRVVAFTGTVKTKFDWGDMVSFDTVVDLSFSVWDANNYQGIVTSQTLPSPPKYWAFDPSGETLRISSKGGFVLFGPNIYELP